MQLGRLLPWLATLLWQQVLDGEGGEQLQMLGLRVEKGKLCRCAGEEEVLLGECQLVAPARAPAWQSLYPPEKMWSRLLDHLLPKHGRRCRRAGSALLGWCAASWKLVGV